MGWDLYRPFDNPCRCFRTLQGSVLVGFLGQAVADSCYRLGTSSCIQRHAETLLVLNYFFFALFIADSADSVMTPLRYLDPS